MKKEKKEAPKKVAPKKIETVTIEKPSEPAIQTLVGGRPDDRHPR